MTDVGDPRQLRNIGKVNPKTGMVEMSREAYLFVYNLFKRTGGDTDAVEAAQTAAESAEGALVYVKGDPSMVFAWRSDPSGVFPAGDPTQALTLEFYDKDGTQIATRTLTGTLDSAAGTVTVANTSNTGLTTTFSTSGGGTDSAKAEIEVELASGSLWGATLAWNAIDVSAAGGTPTSGGGK